MNTGKQSSLQLISVGLCRTPADNPHFYSSGINMRQDCTVNINTTVFDLVLFFAVNSIFLDNKRCYFIKRVIAWIPCQCSDRAKL